MTSLLFSLTSSSSFSSISPWQQRILSGGEGSDSSSYAQRIDYSVLSVAVMTLGLIMVVEVIRHRLDHSASGRPFFKAVLEGVYAELATLGMVEFFIWLLHSYYSGLDMAKEQVFAKVHFTLFYTAILNAFQSVVLAVLTTRVSYTMWVQTETLELNHYVEIREEFCRVKAELESLKHMKRNNNEQAADRVAHTEDDEDDPSAEFVLEFTMKAFRGVYQSFIDHIRYPGLNHKYTRLLTQVRFHELRIHLLQAHNLPLKLKISDYLIRCEKAVLIKLVHVSIVAWLLLTACVNVLYFVLGIVATETENEEIVETVLTELFFWTLGLFILVSYLVFNKMKRIYKKIMHQKTLWDFSIVDEERKEALAHQQLKLFWGDDPKLVISSIQFMQFGYAVALSVMLIFRNTIKEGDVVMGWYFFAIIGCYVVFILVTAQVIPRYTLCTSLGQLVDMKRLNETVAQFHLQEIKRVRLEELELALYENSAVLCEPNTLLPTAKMSTPGKERVRRRGKLVRSASDGAKRMAIGSGRDKSKTEEFSLGGRMTSDHCVDSATLMAELVKLDTNALRTTLPQTEREVLLRRERDRSNRGRRQKANSEGVAAMAADSKKPPRRTMDDIGLNESRRHILMSDTASFDNLSSASMNGNKGKEQLYRKGRRKKSVSDGVAAMAYAPRFEQNEKLVKISENLNPSEFDDSISNVDASQDVTAASTISSLCNRLIAIPESSQNLMDLSKLDNTQAEMQQDLEADDKTFNSEHSDFYDVPNADPTLFGTQSQSHRPHISVIDRLRLYYLGRQFMLISNVFGTMVAFFFVGERVERFLHTESIISDEFITFDFNPTLIFWLLFVWLVMFLITDVVIFYVLGRFSNLHNNIERKVFVSSVVDVVIVSTCITSLLVAQANRCCSITEVSHRHLAEITEASQTSGGYHPAEPTPCDCPIFGSRVYGGLGKIEPFVSLVALRLFRQWLAKRIISFAVTKTRWSIKEYGGESSYINCSTLNPFAVFGDHEVEDHLTDEGTIMELWENAVGRHSDIVARYGQFSGELLQAMLGVAIEGKNEIAPLDPTNEVDRLSKDCLTGMTESDSETLNRPKLSRGKSFAVDKGYSTLSKHAQEIIMAGRLGRAVKYVTNNRGDDTEEHRVFGGTVSELSNTSTITGAPHFEVDPEETILPEIVAAVSAPHARLVRSLRRCDRKLLPFLDKWTVVDVAITKFEMVYFEASDVDGNVLDRATADVKQALEATKGGKGLRLCDVTTGRKVVGHLQISEIKNAFVEREIPDGNSITDTDGPELEVSKTEYWHANNDKIHFARAPLWREIKQDRLKIESKNGTTLYLRFYSDLDDANHHRDRQSEENEVKGPIFKNNAFQWAQTIGRFCGPEQLKQHLPHFGDSTSNELRDYLTVHHHHHEGRHPRRGSSVLHDANRHPVSSSTGLRLPSFRRGKSMSSV